MIAVSIIKYKCPFVDRFLEPARSVRTMSSTETGTTHLSLFASKEVQSVDEVYHTVAVDSVVFGILSHGCTDGTADVALIFQNVIELNAYCSCIAF